MIQPREPRPGEEIHVKRTGFGVRLVSQDGDSILPDGMRSFRIELDDDLVRRTGLENRIQFPTTSHGRLLFCNGTVVPLTVLKDGFLLRVPND